MMKNLKTYKQLFENLNKDYIYLSHDFNSDPNYDPDTEVFIDFIKDKNPNIIDSNKEPLVFHIYYNNYLYKSEIKDIIKIMIKNGLDVNVKYETTLLYEIANDQQIDYELMYILIDAGADWTIEFNGDTFLDVMYNNEREKVIEKYPEKYERYLKNRKAKEFNL